MSAPAETAAAEPAAGAWSPAPQPVEKTPHGPRPPVVQFEKVTKKFRRGRTWSTLRSQ